MAEPVILVCNQFDDFGFFLQESDKRQEQVPLQAVMIEFVGMTVGGDHDDYAQFEQPAEQSHQNHRVGDVGDMELVEAKQQFRCPDMFCQGGNRIGIVLPAPLVDEGVDFQHEGMKMHPAFLTDRAGLKKQIHQHGFAAAYVAVDIQALVVGRFG